MIPPNAYNSVQARLIDDYLMYGNCRSAERTLCRHFENYDCQGELSYLSRRCEEEMRVLLDDCIILIAASARRQSVLNLIKERIAASELQAFRIFAVAEYRWSSQMSGESDDQR